MSELSSLQRYRTKSTAGMEFSEDFFRGFKDNHPTKKDCTEALVRLIEPEAGFHCRTCRRNLRARKYGEKMVRCMCGTRNFLLADSMFSNIRRPDAWWGYFCALKKRWHTSSNKFAEVFDTSSSTSHRIFGVFATVIRNELCKGKLLSSAEFITLFIKRSYETEARKHPDSEEVSLNRQATTAPIRAEPQQPIQQVPEPDLNHDEKVIYDMLSHHPVLAAEIYSKSQIPTHLVSVSLTMLEIKGCARRLLGDLWERIGQQPVEAPAVPKLATSALSALVFDAFNDFIRDIHHGISRKYLQNYLAMFWYHVAKTRWNTRALVRACRASPPITGKEIFSAVTPPQIRLSVRENQIPRC